MSDNTITPPPFVPPVPRRLWARVDGGRVLEIIGLPADAEPTDFTEPGDWHYCTSAQPPAAVGLVLANGAYTLPRWAQVAGGKVVTVVEQVESPGDCWVDCTGQHVGPGCTQNETDGFGPPPGAPRLITVAAFRARFTRAEKGAIEALAVQDPELRADLADVAVQPCLNLDSLNVRRGPVGLEAAGVLAPGRAVEILDAPLQPWEAFSGAGHA